MSTRWRGLDRRFDPVALWKFDQSLRDYSGNGFDLQVVADETGKNTYGRLNWTGPSGWIGDQGSYLEAPQDPLLRIYEDLTIEVMVQQGYMGNISGTILQHRALTSESGVQLERNALYALGTDSTAERRGTLQFWNEHGTGGTDSIWNSPVRATATGKAQLVAFTRTNAGTVRGYTNGQFIGTSSVTLPTAGSGTAGRIRLALVGTTTTTQVPLFISNIKIFNKVLTDDEVNEEFMRTLGYRFPRVA